MTATCFVDTNVLVNARDSTESAKQPVAATWREALWRARLGRLSHQMLHGYYVTVIDPFGVRPEQVLSS